MQFEHTAMQLLKFREYAKQNPTFKKAFTNDITPAFSEELAYRTNGKKENHIVLFIHGETGTLKSSAAQVLAQKIQPDFRAEQIVFTNPGIRELMPTLGTKTVIIRDESPKDYGIGSGRSAQQVQEYAETLRQEEKSLIFIRPVDEYFPSAHFKLRTIDHSSDFRFVRLGVLEPHSNRYLGFIVVEITPNNALWNAYQLRKKDFLKRVLNEDMAQMDYAVKAKAITEREDYPLAKNKKDLKLLIVKEFPRLTIAEIDLILSELIMFHRK